MVSVATIAPRRMKMIDSRTCDPTIFKINIKLDCGFLEKVYENAMSIELGKMGCKVLPQKR